MKPLILIIILGCPLLSFAGDAKECSSLTIEPDFEATAETYSKECSANKIYTDSKSTDAPLASYFDVPNDKICACLEGAKFNEIRVPTNRAKDFKQWEYDQAIREKLKASFNDMVANFSKFKILSQN